eukprot:4045343-Prymnesium_polylepis.1
MQQFHEINLFLKLACCGVVIWQHSLRCNAHLRALAIGTVHNLRHIERLSDKYLAGGAGPQLLAQLPACRAATVRQQHVGVECLGPDPKT